MLDKRCKHSVILILLYWMAMQDFILGIIYHYSGSTFLTRIIFFGKDLFMVCMFLYIIFAKGLARKLMIPLLLYFLLLLCQIVIPLGEGTTSLMGMLQSVRSLILLPCFLTIGYSMSNKVEFRWMIVNKYYPFLVFVAIVGIVEYALDYVVGTKEFWTGFVGLGSFMVDIKGQAGRLLFGLPGNFYGSYGEGYFSQKRLVSFWASPLTAGYALLLPTIYYFFETVTVGRKRHRFINKKLICFLVCFIGVYLTHTRAVLIPLFAVIAGYYAVKFRRNAFYLILIIVAAFVGLSIIDYSKLLSFLYDGSTKGHILAVTESIRQISVMGKGVGSFGISGGGIGTESAYLSILGQLGGGGLGLFLVLLIIPTRKLYFSFKRHKKENYLIGVLVVSVIYLVTGFISEQLLAYTTIAPFYILLGCEYGFWLNAKQ